MIATRWLETLIEIFRRLLIKVESIVLWLSPYVYNKDRLWTIGIGVCFLWLNDQLHHMLSQLASHIADDVFL